MLIIMSHLPLTIPLLGLLLDTLLSSSTVGYPSDSLAFCCIS